MAIKKCVICGKEFVDYGRGKYCNGPHFKTCVICGKEFEYDVRAAKKPETCSRSCASKLARKAFQFKPKVCLKCNSSYIPTSSKQKYCENCKI